MIISDTFGYEVNLGKENLYIAACYIPHKESNYYSRFGLEHDDPITNLSQGMLVFEKLVKVFHMGDFNARVRKYQNTEILEENIVDPGLLHDSKDCIMMDYGRILIHMLDCTDMIVLNGINVFPLTNVLTCLLPQVDEV